MQLLIELWSNVESENQMQVSNSTKWNLALADLGLISDLLLIITFYTRGLPNNFWIKYMKVSSTASKASFLGILDK